MRSRFLSTPSARRATPPALRPPRTPFNFYPRPPRGGRPKRACTNWGIGRISIHALREEGDGSLPLSGVSYVLISIHALREEGDWGAGMLFA